MRLVPLLLIAVVAYNLLAFGGSVTGYHDMQAVLSGNLLVFSVISGDEWRFSVGDFFILLALCLLFVEIVKSTRTSQRQLFNHGLSMVTFVIALVEFITLRGFATSAFFFILAMSFFDVVAGYTISVVTAKRDIGLGQIDMTD